MVEDAENNSPFFPLWLLYDKAIVYLQNQHDTASSNSKRKLKRLNAIFKLSTLSTRQPLEALGKEVKFT